MSAMRVFLIVTGLVMWLGIWLSGFNQVHWLLYLQAAVLPLAGITGFCPGLKMLRKMGFSGPDLTS